MALPDCINPDKIIPISRLSTEVFKTGSWGTRLPVHREKLSPCRAACPAGEDIPAYVGLAAKREPEAAFLKITEENPLPAVCGRVCYHPCEGSCIRSGLDGEVSIHRIERAVGDYGIERLRLHPPGKDSGFSVAVVGSGPAGLSCAYHSRRLGHRVTLFEAEKELGGLLRLGIPAYRLPREVLDRSIRMILQTGIRTESGFSLGEQSTWDRLETFDAVFLAVGAHDPLLPKLSGMGHPGVMDGIGFLKEVNRGDRKRVDGPVAVMGGGNTAIDAARVSLRLGSETTLLYRRSREEMPASPEEIEDAILEGVKLVTDTLPVAVRAVAGGLIVTCVKTEAAGKEESGRTIYRPVEGSQFELEVKTLILGTGQAVRVPELHAPISITREGVGVSADLHAGGGKYFAGGDAVPGQRRVCDAIGSGKLAALSLHARLNGMDFEALLETARIGSGHGFSMQHILEGGEPKTGVREPVRVEDVKFEWFEPSIPYEVRRVGPRESVQGFDEVIPGVSAEEVAHSSGRCLSCGTCTACDRCHLHCPEISMIPPAAGGALYHGSEEFCKGCGVCASVCPRGVMTMSEGK
jgi:formate dehydrogenase (NADP+) beta subunit